MVVKDTTLKFPLIVPFIRGLDKSNKPAIETCTVLGIET